MIHISVEVLHLAVTLPANCSGLLGSFNCDSDGLCAYTASYEVQQDNSITFIVSARTSPFSWVGIGVSDDQRMVSAAMYISISHYNSLSLVPIYMYHGGRLMPM